jgi:uncharacterized DUF497 family protein
MELIIEWDEQKNTWLKNNRGVSFEDVENAILSQAVLDIVPHHNTALYPHQEIIILKIGEYIYYVPFIQQEKVIFLKTIIPSRKLNKQYIQE